jgi:hypothetical protein
LASSFSSSRTLSTLGVSEGQVDGDVELHAWVVFQGEFSVRGFDLIWCCALFYLEDFVWVYVVGYVILEVLDL